MKYTLVTYNERMTNYGEDIWVSLFDDLEEVMNVGAAWMDTYPRDIVMVVAVEIGICKHCEQKIQEKPGWVMHKWMHVGTRAYTCLNAALTQAEPKEVT